LRSTGSEAVRARIAIAWHIAVHGVHECACFCVMQNFVLVFTMEVLP
jgi:hypothetical protein